VRNFFNIFNTQSHVGKIQNLMGAVR